VSTPDRMLSGNFSCGTGGLMAVYARR
jgi:hypothetical protein